MEDNEQIQVNPIDYLPTLESIKCNHSKIQEKVDRLIEILKNQITQKKQSLINFESQFKRIEDKTEDEEFKFTFGDMDIFKHFIPDLLREFKNLNTTNVEEQKLLAEYIKHIVLESNELKNNIVKEPIIQKKELMDEQEKMAFEQAQLNDFGKLNDVTNKGSFNVIVNRIKARCDTKEKEILANNICLEKYSRKLEDIEWKYGTRKKTNVKSAK